MAPRDQHVANEGVRLAVRDYGGTGTAVLLLHGLRRNLGDWELVVPRLLEAGRRVVGFDLRGHGQSDEPPTWTYADNVSDIEAVVAALSLANPYVIGHSLGGMTAAHYGAAHGNCAGVANVDGHGTGSPSVPQWLAATFAAARPPADDLPADSGDQDWMEAELAAMRSALESLGVPWEIAAPAVRRGYVVDGSVYRRRPSNRLMDLIPRSGAELFDLYRSVECPLLIVNCDRIEASDELTAEDQRTYRDALAKDLQRLASERPNVTVANIHSGHAVVVEKPHVIAELIVSFTERR